jgi:hypothetical protein
MSENSKYQLPFLLLGFAAVLLLWNTPLVYPVKLFTVFLHELSHGLAAVLTGGRIVSLKVTADQGGLATTAGGWELLIIPAGYLGSMLFGGLILTAASRSKADKLISLFIALTVAAVTVLFVRNLFGFAFGLAFAAGLAALGRWGGTPANDFVLRLLGLTSILYAVIDIYSDLIVRTVPCSDASAMSRLLFGPPAMWGVLWMVLALAAAAFFLKLSLGRASGENVNRRTQR